MKTGNYERNRILEAAILFALFYLPGFLFQSPAASSRAFDSIEYNFQIWVLFLPRIALLVYLISRDRKTVYGDFGLVKPSTRDIPWLVFTMAAVAGMASVIQILSSLFPIFTGNGGFQWKITHVGMLPLIFVSSMITGYSEELFFRSYLYTRLEQLGGGKTSAIIIVNLLFSMGHFYEGPAGTINAFAMGSLFSLIYLKKRNIHIPAAVHGLYNFTALLLSLFM